MLNTLNGVSGTPPPPPPQKKKKKKKKTNFFIFLTYIVYMYMIFLFHAYAPFAKIECLFVQVLYDCSLL